MLGRGDRVHNTIGCAAHSAPTKLGNHSIATRALTEAVSRLFIQPDATRASMDAVSRLFIRPDVNEFFPCDTVNIISAIIKSIYEKPWVEWTKIPNNVKRMWSEEFKKYCKWDDEDHEEIVRIWKRKSAQIVREMIVVEELHRRMDVLEKQNERLRSELGFMHSFLKKLAGEQKCNETDEQKQKCNGTDEQKCNETDEVLRNGEDLRKMLVGKMMIWVMISALGVMMMMDITIFVKFILDILCNTLLF